MHLIITVPYRRLTLIDIAFMTNGCTLWNNILQKHFTKYSHKPFNFIKWLSETKDRCIISPFNLRPKVVEPTTICKKKINLALPCSEFCVYFFDWKFTKINRIEPFQTVQFLYCLYLLSLQPNVCTYTNNKVRVYNQTLNNLIWKIASWSRNTLLT